METAKEIWNTVFTSYRLYKTFIINGLIGMKAGGMEKCGVKNIWDAFGVISQV